jgi:uncharacterized protein (DUF305 family)
LKAGLHGYHPADHKGVGVRRTVVLIAAMMAALWVAGWSDAAADPQIGSVHNHADVMFAMHMVPHHQQAIDMSDIVLAKPNIDPRVVDLATRIKAAQAPEIVAMQGWLNSWGMSGGGMMPGGMPGMGPGGGPMMPGSPGAGGPGMGGMGGMGMMGMGGMASESEMAALRAAAGVGASRLYLNLMIPHHEGAITMAQNEIANGEFPDEITLCRSIVASQQLEIGEMNTILATL